jgi:hypothetical protein
MIWFRNLPFLSLPLFVACGSSTTEPVDLGSAGNYVILAKAAVSTVPLGTSITGDVGISPAAADAITQFDLVLDASGAYATSSLVTGRVYAADYAVPTPDNLSAAVTAMEAAFTDAAGRSADVTELGGGNIGGMALGPGVYKWGTGLLIPTDVQLTGGPEDVWIFQIAADLTVSDGARIELSRGALAENVVWQVGGRVDVGTTAHIEGFVLSRTAIDARTGASVNGKLLAQSAVSLDGVTLADR